MGLKKEKDFVMDLFLISFRFHSLSTLRFIKKKRKKNTVVLWGLSSCNLVGFLMCRYPLASHVKVSTLVSDMSQLLLSEECV